MVSQALARPAMPLGRGAHRRGWRSSRDDRCRLAAAPVPNQAAYALVLSTHGRDVVGYDREGHGSAPGFSAMPQVATTRRSRIPLIPHQNRRKCRIASPPPPVRGDTVPLVAELLEITPVRLRRAYLDRTAVPQGGGLRRELQRGVEVISLED